MNHLATYIRFTTSFGASGSVCQEEMVLYPGEGTISARLEINLSYFRSGREVDRI